MNSSDHSLFYQNEGIILAYAGVSARSGGDVAVTSMGTAIPGTGDLAARICLTAMKFDPEIRSTGIIRYCPEIIGTCRDLLMEACFFDRMREPPGGRLIDWGVAFCCERTEGVPDVIYDTGTDSLPGLIRVFGMDPTEVAGSINRILTRISNTNF
jgi:hydroxymethylpyrimidine/phosphomethylpyrimidine kinase